MQNADCFLVLYRLSLGYVLSPDKFSSASIIGFFQGTPDAIKYSDELILASPFTVRR
jgi:hypothetical protein